MENHLQSVPIGKIRPNTWNPNYMDDSKKEKLKFGIKKLLKKEGMIPPLVVRSVKERFNDEDYEIIDGEHRWRILKDLGQKDCSVLIFDNLSDSDAKILTSSLNYLKGEANPEEYANLLSEILSEGEYTVDGLAYYVPETQNEIESLLEQYNLTEGGLGDGDLGDMPDSTGDDTDDSEKFTELTFLVPKRISDVIQWELDRISAYLKEKEGDVPPVFKALEVMAVNSSNTATEQFFGE